MGTPVRLGRLLMKRSRWRLTPNASSLLYVDIYDTFSDESAVFGEYLVVKKKLDALLFRYLGSQSHYDHGISSMS